MCGDLLNIEQASRRIKSGKEIFDANNPMAEHQNEDVDIKITF